MLSCWKNNSGTTVGVSLFVVTQERLEINSVAGFEPSVIIILYFK